jgi:hypothetical protein
MIAFLVVITYLVIGGMVNGIVWATGEKDKEPSPGALLLIFFFWWMFLAVLVGVWIGQKMKEGK